MNQLDNASFRDLNEMTVIVAQKFFYAKKIKLLDHVPFIGELGFTDVASINSFLEKVEKAYKTLNDLEKNLINNEFFYQSYNQWWEPLYSKASFYRYKKEAMQKFLEAIYEL